MPCALAGLLWGHGLCAEGTGIEACESHPFTGAWIVCFSVVPSLMNEAGGSCAAQLGNLCYRYVPFYGSRLGCTLTRRHIPAHEASFQEGLSFFIGDEVEAGMLWAVLCFTSSYLRKPFFVWHLMYFPQSFFA